MGWIVDTVCLCCRRRSVLCRHRRRRLRTGTDNDTVARFGIDCTSFYVDEIDGSMDCLFVPRLQLYS